MNEKLLKSEQIDLFGLDTGILWSLHDNLLHLTVAVAQRDAVNAAELLEMLRDDASRMLAGMKEKEEGEEGGDACDDD